MRTTHEDKALRLIEPSPDPAVAANPPTDEEIRAAALVVIAQTDLDRVREETFRKARDRRGFTTFGVMGAGERIDDGGLLMINPDHWPEFKAAEAALQAANAHLSELRNQRMNRIRRWTAQHQEDPQAFDYQPTDPRFGVFEPLTRPAVSADPERVKLQSAIQKTVHKLHVLLAELAKRPRDANLAGQIETNSEEQIQARAKLTDFDRRKQAKASAEQIQADIDAARKIAAPGGKR